MLWFKSRSLSSLQASKGAHTCCGKEGYFCLSDAILQKNVKWLSADWTHSCSYWEKEKKKKRRSIPISLLSLSLRCSTVDDHERELIVLTAGHPGSLQIEGSATAALIIPPFPLPLLVIATRRVQEFLSTCWWFLARFNLCFPLSGEEFKFSYTARRKCSHKVVPVPERPASLWIIPLERLWNRLIKCYQESRNRRGAALL